MLNIIYKEIEYQNSAFQSEIIFRYANSTDKKAFSDFIIKENLNFGENLKTRPYIEALEESKFDLFKTPNAFELIVSCNPYHIGYIVELLLEYTKDKSLITDLEFVTIINYSLGDSYYEKALEWFKENEIEYLLTLL